MWIYNLNQVIWLAENWKWAWHFNLFSMTRVNWYGRTRTSGWSSWWILPCLNSHLPTHLWDLNSGCRTVEKNPKLRNKMLLQTTEYSCILYLDYITNEAKSLVPQQRTQLMDWSEMSHLSSIVILCWTMTWVLLLTSQKGVFLECNSFILKLSN